MVVAPLPAEDAGLVNTMRCVATSQSMVQHGAVSAEDAGLVNAMQQLLNAVSDLTKVRWGDRVATRVLKVV